MRASLLCMVLVLAGVIFGKAQDSSKIPAEEGRLLALESAWNHAEQSKDAVALNQLLGESLVYTDYDGTLAHLPHAGPLFAGSRPAGESITVHVFATVPSASDLHGHARTITLAISLNPR